jgi:hypothetical protein
VTSVTATCPQGQPDANGQCTSTSTAGNICPTDTLPSGTGQGTCTASPSCPTGSTQNGGVCQTSPVGKEPKPK